MAKKKKSTTKKKSGAKPRTAAKKKSVAKAKAPATSKTKIAAKTKSKATARPKSKAPAAKKKSAAKTKGAPRREDRPGHYDPKYAAKLRRLGRRPRDDDRAFVGGRRSDDDLAEELGEEAVVAMTSGEDGLAEDMQAEVPEESGGPFVRSSGGKEFADGTDASNPKDALREPFPKT